MDILSLIIHTLRDPQALVDQHDRPEGVAALTPRLLTITAGGAAILGAVVGSYRGELQMVYVAAKMPFLLFIPVLVTLPAVHAAWRAAEVQITWQRLALASLVGLSRSAVLAAAAAPVLWLLYSMQVDYHLATLAMVAVLGAVGLPGFFTLLGAAPRGGRTQGLATLGCLVLLGLTSAQTGWLLRPFLARPTAEVAFLRPIEADVFSALFSTSRSATGYYPGWEVSREPAEAERLYSEDTTYTLENDTLRAGGS